MEENRAKPGLGLGLSTKARFTAAAAAGLHCK